MATCGYQTSHTVETHKVPIYFIVPVKYNIFVPTGSWHLEHLELWSWCWQCCQVSTAVCLLCAGMGSMIMLPGDKRCRCDSISWIKFGECIASRVGKMEVLSLHLSTPHEYSDLIHEYPKWVLWIHSQRWFYRQTKRQTNGGDLQFSKKCKSIKCNSYI